jgi:peptide/nickel transport system substrate-binding protein
MSLNRQQVLDEYYKGNGLVAWTFSNPGSAPYYVPIEELPDELRQLYEYHPDKAKKLLADAGYADGFDTELLCPPSMAEWCELYAAQMRDVGIRVALDVMEEAAYHWRLGAGDNPGLIANDYGGIVMSGNIVFNSVWFSGVVSTPYNGKDFVDPVLDNMFIDYRGTLDPEENLRKYLDMAFYTAEQTYLINGVAEAKHIYWQPWLKGYSGEHGYLADFHRVLKYAWIDQDLK